MATTPFLLTALEHPAAVGQEPLRARLLRSNADRRLVRRVVPPDT